MPEVAIAASFPTEIQTLSTPETLLGPCTAPESRVEGVALDTTSYQYPGPAKHSRTQDVALSPAAA